MPKRQIAPPDSREPGSCIPVVGRVRLGPRISFSCERLWYLLAPRGSLWRPSWSSWSSPCLCDSTQFPDLPFTPLYTLSSFLGLFIAARSSRSPRRRLILYSESLFLSTIFFISFSLVKHFPFRDAWQFLGQPPAFLPSQPSPRSEKPTLLTASPRILALVAGFAAGLSFLFCVAGASVLLFSPF